MKKKSVECSYWDNTHKFADKPIGIITVRSEVNPTMTSETKDNKDGSTILKMQLQFIVSSDGQEMYRVAVTKNHKIEKNKGQEAIIKMFKQHHLELMECVEKDSILNSIMPIKVTTIQKYQVLEANCLEPLHDYLKRNY